MVASGARLLRLLERVSWRSYRATPARLILVIGGIAAGVALIAAIGLVNASVLANFRTMIERSAGKAALQIELGTGEVGFDAAVAERAAADPDVEHAYGMVRGTLHATDDSGEILQLFGVDLVAGASDSYDVRVEGDEDALELLNDPHSVLLTRDYAARRGIDVGAPVRFATPTGITELHVRGLLQATGIASVFGGNLAVMDLPAAQRLFGKVDRVDQVEA
jgi:putative ABC transport system permease protein